MKRVTFLFVSIAVQLAGADFAGQVLNTSGVAKLGDPPDSWTCQPSASTLKDYCEQSLPKSLAQTADCSEGWQTYENSDATNIALRECQKKAGRDCFTYDNNGRNCFSGCARDWPFPGITEAWHTYCSSRSAGKTWYMPDDCSIAWYKTKGDAKGGCEDHTNGKSCQLFDDGGVTVGPHCLPACKQLESEWCWATATAELASYWNPSKFPVRGDDCTGLECQIASWVTKKDCCGDKASCNAANAVSTEYLREVAGAPAYKYTPGQLSEAHLQTALAAGPIAIRIAWPNGGAHFVTVGGVNRAGDRAGVASYFLHDPLKQNQAGKYQDVAYAHIKVYQEPLHAKNQDRYTGNWDGTIHVASTNFQEEMVTV